MSIERHEPASSSPRDVFRHYVGDLVYGANDGIVTTFTIVSGAAGAHLSPAVVIILGCVNLLADGFSMGASNFLAIRSGAAAEGKDRGMAEPVFHGLATFAAFVVAGAAPLVAYLLPGAGAHSFLSSCVSSGVALFTVGALRSIVAQKRWMRSGIEFLLVGALAAAVAYGAGSAVAGWVGQGLPTQ